MTALDPTRLTHFAAQSDRLARERGPAPAPERDRAAELESELARLQENDRTLREMIADRDAALDRLQGKLDRARSLVDTWERKLRGQE